MATNKARIQKLESGRGKQIEYLCISNAGDTEYTARRATGEAFTFKTLAAMTAFFDKHKEFELTHIQIVYAEPSQNKAPPS